MVLTSRDSDLMVDETEWWALYTRHQHEKVVADTLVAKDFEVFFPQYETVRRWQDRSKKITLPIFPCYVFVRGVVGRRLAIVSTPGIHTIVTCGDRIAGIPDNEIQAIRRAVSGSAAIEPHPFLKCGDLVEVKRGPMQGVQGILVRKKNLYRLVLSVDMLAQSVAVEIDAADVTSIAPQRLAIPPVHVISNASQGRGTYGLARQ